MPMYSGIYGSGKFLAAVSDIPGMEGLIIWELNHERVIPVPDWKQRLTTRQHAKLRLVPALMPS
jgi:hypothetical protein